MNNNTHSAAATTTPPPQMAETASFTNQDSTSSYDEQATVCAIETFAEHWTEAQAFSVATLAACAITALENSRIDTLPWKHTFLRTLFRQLGIHSREEQEMLLLLQENGSYQDCNLQVLAEPLLPRTYHRHHQQQGSRAHSHESSRVTSPISSPPASPSRTRRSIQKQRTYGPNSVSSSPVQGPFLGQDPYVLEPELDIRTEIINDLLYIGLGFEPSSRSRKNVPIQELSNDLAGLDLDVPPTYSELDDRYTIAATDSKQGYGYETNKNDSALLSPVRLRPPSLPPRQDQQEYQEQQFGMPPQLPPRMLSSASASTSVSSSSLSSSSSSQRSKKGRVQPLEYDARARAVIFTMCNYLLLSYESFLVIEKQIAQHLYFYQQELIEAERAELERERRLKEEQQRLQQYQQQGSGPGAKVGAFFSGLRSNRSNGHSSVPLNQHGVAMQTQAQSSMHELEKKKKTWKYLATGLSIAAGATVIGLTGGLAAPLVAVGAGVLLGSGAAVLGTTAGIAVMASLFGLAGGGLAGYKMHRRTKDLKTLSFVPIVKDPTLPQIPSLHLAIVISGYLFEESEVVETWQGTAEHALEGIDVFHLTFEPAELVTLGNAFKVFVATEAVRMVSTQVIQQTVFAALASALVLPFGLMRAGDLIDNPWAVAMDRARKSGFVLADILMERVQGNRPTTLIGYSTGAVVIWECLLELAKRKEHGLINTVVLLGAPIKTDETEKWKAASSVVAHRFINGYSKKDVVLGSIFRLHALGLDVAGLQPVKAVPHIENVDLSDIVGGHLEYHENLNMVISLLGVL
ncbi:hypothetical protein BC939DRAFT_463075 [Gamsiella multidivaricata]|uniref:uncharacterized protein n=1 Tax=Gamsiella multidivaricata TaxID=101098 RepID=UPI002220C2BA|nr:uncharacterized protein BC939DRAFT_463075 [Gamsiella multidivaricata]KAG0361241.1 hypothetical protein BGZ54_009167 [Gamsiella multidivaricata]KAI7818386.1 hypothetical protein BC939DRAFT_463075 [Gamsiella multidivaricata]